MDRLWNDAEELLLFLYLLTPEQASLQAPASSPHRLPAEGVENVSPTSVLALRPLHPVCVHVIITSHSIN